MEWIRLVWIYDTCIEYLHIMKKYSGGKTIILSTTWVAMSAAVLRNYSGCIMDVEGSFI